MKKHNRWLCPTFILWLIVTITSCGDAPSKPNGNTNLGQAYRTASAASVPLPNLANRLAFNRDGMLLSTNTDGSGVQTIAPDIDVSGRAVWSPDGAYLAVAGETGTSTDIFVLALDSEGRPIERYNITQSPTVQESAPAWSPNGENLAYGAERSGNWGIYVMEIGLFGSHRDPMIFSDRKISQHSQSLHYKSAPVWSPDGKWLSYTSDAGNRWQVTLVELYSPITTSQLGTEIPVAGTGYASSAVSLCWSPDGSRQVFAANPNGNWDLFIVDGNSASVRPLTTHSADDWNPAWSPDGEWIAFTSSRSGNSDIYLITANGAAIAQLTDTPNSEDYVTWLPRQTSQDIVSP